MSATINKISFRSESLVLNVNANIVFSESFQRKDYKLLYLLHGYSENYEVWLNHTRLVDYIKNKSIAVFMPCAMNSFYINGNFSMFNFFKKDIPKMLSDTFDLNHQNAYIGGLSMGGYGAMNLGFRLGYFKGVAALSSVINLLDFFKQSNPKIFKQNNPEELINLENIKNYKGIKTKLYLACGQQDQFYEDNLNFIKELSFLDLKKLGISFKDDMNLNYGHEWDYWNLQLKQIIKWMHED